MEQEEDFDEPKWTTECINIRPGHAWHKYAGTIAYITHCSFAVPNNLSNDEYCAILTADTWDESTVLCKLMPSDVSKKMKIVLCASQTFYLSNKGNRTMTVSMLTKRTIQ